MPYVPLDFRPVPEESPAARSVAPSSSYDVAREELAISPANPIVDYTGEKQPTRRTTPKPRPRGFSTGEPTIDMKKWEVNPYRIARDLGI